MGNIELADFTSPRRGRSRQASRGAKKRGGGLNLCGSYAGLPESGGVNGGTVTSHLRCAPGGPCCGPRSDAPESSNGISKWSSVIHMLVHPGCSSGHTNCEDRSDASGGVGRITPMSEENLNVSSAMLHLVADFILIGAVALFKRFYVALRRDCSHEGVAGVT